jgi:anti-anti-sigma factor
VATYELDRTELGESGLAHFALSGELDLGNADELARRLDELTNGHAAIVLDLTRVAFIDSAAIHRLFRIARERGPLAMAFVVEPTSPIAATLEIAGLRRAVPVAATLEEAKTALAR